MKRIVTTALFASLLASTAAFADGGIGHNGTYNDQSWIGAGAKTRAEVVAERDAAWREGTLASLNKTTYPNLSLQGQTQAERLALQEGNNGVAVARAGE
ncbi:DUF4148 domain-containing protein [Trinickia sp. EG282A]|uniref:DUF4148 domain-containing protein n=1 Tax=Trinickia sp. EG282A TaxID=3237013 RepID=UPI0034D288B9